MKKGILFLGLLGGIFAANAQSVPSTPVVIPSTATLNVNLYPLQAITVNPVTSVVDLDYKTITNYVDGVSKDVKDHLAVISTSGFAVKVRSVHQNLTSADGGSIALADIKITSSKGSSLGNLSNSISATDYAGATPVTLNSTAEQSIGSSTKAGAGMINVKYNAAGNNKYLNMVGGATKKTYTASIQYSIIAN